jgi:heptosyltransferase II
LSLDGQGSAPVPDRVVVWQPAYVGDVIFASPLTAAMRRAWPRAEIAFVASPPASDLAGFLPGVSRVVAYDKRGRERGPASALRLVRTLRGFHPDLWVSLHESLRSGLVARAVNARRTIGPGRGAGSALFRERVSWPGDATFPARAVALAHHLGLAADPALQLDLPEALVARGRAVLGARTTVALIPGSVWATKRWPADHLGQLAREVLAAGKQVLLLGSPAERALCAEVQRAAGGRCLDRCGDGLPEALGMLALCSAAVGADSGLVHAARALGVPTLMLFGPTASSRHEAGATDRFLSLGLSCSPCSTHGDDRCPLGHHRCMVDLTTETVAAALTRLPDRSA